MLSIRLSGLTFITMLCFAGNSVFCRLALRQTSIDAASFTAVRLVCGALVLALLVYGRQRFLRARDTRPNGLGGNWISSLALFIYASALSYSYADMSTGIGALLLFGAVQATMILTGLWRGERLNSRQTVGLVLALAGVGAILSYGLDAPPISSALLMLTSGVAWGVYSLRGRGVADPTGDTAGNFLRASSMSVLLSVFFLAHQHLDRQGVLYAMLSGAITSGLGYAIWYAVLPKLTRTRAAAVQLSVPVFASLAGALFVNEPITLNLMLTSAAVLGGIALVVYSKHSAI
jgi:drug/metabolite transporter (DMT)-like permease